jgi:hypothetical protein
MKLARWKVLSLAGALVLGYVASADAAQIKVSDETWADYALDMKIWYKYLDKRAKSPADGSWNQNVFDVGEVELRFEGQVTPLFQFYAELPTNGADGTTTIDEAAINLAFAKEFQVLAGELRKPFTRAEISSSYAYLTPQGYWLDPQKALGAIRTPWDPKKNNQDSGLMVHGDLLDGMFRYRVGVYNEHRDLDNKLWVGTFNSTNAFGWIKPGKFNIDGSTFTYGQTPNTKANDLKNVEWNARIEFTPTMLGFKPESAATLNAKVADTYLGAKDVLTIGLGYHTATHTPKASINGENLGDLKRKGWTVDAMFEKKFGNLVPNLQIGYITLDDTHYYVDYRKETFKKGDTDVWYVTGQLLFDQCVWLGKPAIAFRYEKITGDGQWTDGTILKKDLTAETFGLAFNYYIKGQAARISVGFDHTKYDDALKYFLKYGDPNTKKEDSITDWYLYLQSKF